MPYKHITMHIKPEHNRRVKLDEETKEEIRANPDGLSQRKLAALYGVSRRLITFILDPQKLADNKAARALRGGSKVYYNKEKNTVAQREHRQYKQTLMLSGLLKEQESK